MIVEFLLKQNWVRKTLFARGKNRGNYFADILGKLISKNDKVLDIGAGLGIICSELIERGYNVLPLDVHSISVSDKVVPQIYDGKTMPFKDKEFDASLLLMVLHHIKDYKEVLKEAGRVSKKIIVIEDIYNNRFEKFRTQAIDSLLNLEFFSHARSNHNEAGWESVFKELGFKVVSKSYAKTFMVQRHAVYLIETNQA